MTATFEDAVRVYLPGRRDPKIVCLGGGHGMSTMLRGLKRYTRNITAIVTVADDGGGSGALREDLGMPPPGDIRNCILALANTEPTMERLLNYRFQEGTLSGQSFGNLFLAAMNGISETFDEAVHRMGDVLAITGRVLPVTNQSVHLEAAFDNGARVLGESKIAVYKKQEDCRIDHVRLLPERPEALEESLEAIREADMIVMGPGSLYTSVIPNLLVAGVPDAIADSRACRVLVMNIMTQEGETEGYTGVEHIRALLRHAGRDVVDVCVANGAPVPTEISAAYRAEDAEPVELCREEIERMGIRVYCYPLLARGQNARHDSDALARALMAVLGEYAVR
ncbi:MAG: YvcK family protein [Oscillospiraceae bacterium]|nr:YvcK family protein [Oscillospiraceae bacterium]